MSQPISWYTSRISAALPTPCFPSTAIVRTLWVAMTSSLLRARSRSLLACRRAARRLVLLLLLFFLAHNFFLLRILCTKTSVLQFLQLLPPFAPEFLVSRGGFGFPSPRRLAHLTRPSRVWCLLTGASPSSRFPRRCCSSLFAFTVGINGLARGFS